MSEPYILVELDHLIDRAQLGTTLCIGTLGFEDRSLGALNSMQRIRGLSKMIYLITHGNSSEIRGHSERFAKQQMNLKRLRSLCDPKGLLLLDCPLDTPDDALNAVVSELKGKAYDSIIFDISTMPKRILFLLFRRVWEISEQNVIAIYSTPSEYSSEPLFYEIGQPNLLPGFNSKNGSKEKLDAWIAILGFEGDSAIKTMQWGSFNKVIPIIAFPGYRAAYVDRVLYANKDLLKQPEMERIYYSSANNPFQTSELINNLLIRLSEYSIVLSPMGPKPHSLGLCLSAIQHDLQVVYAQPWAYNPNYSIGYVTTFAYWLKHSENKPGLSR